MLTLLRLFASLVMILSVLHTLLPAGTLRRTAMMSLGLIAALCFLDALPDTLSLPESCAPTSVLTSTGVEISTLHTVPPDDPNTPAR